jgi:hypothetical protein
MLHLVLIERALMAVKEEGHLAFIGILGHLAA